MAKASPSWRQLLHRLKRPAATLTWLSLPCINYIDEEDGDDDDGDDDGNYHDDNDNHGDDDLRLGAILTWFSLHALFSLSPNFSAQYEHHLESSAGILPGA